MSAIGSAPGRSEDQEIKRITLSALNFADELLAWGTNLANGGQADTYIRFVTSPGTLSLVFRSKHRNTKMLFDLVILLACISLSHAATYNLSRSWSGSDFYDDFTFRTFDDPTHGRVNYVDLNTARNNNLSFASGDTFVMRADSSHVVTPSARGRDSVRIHSKETFSDGVLVLDVTHMPVGCGTWPAFWTCTPGSWPVGGEIDIIEGVNGIGTNLASLHTPSGCTMPTTGRIMTGNYTGNDCLGENNSGCGVSDGRVRSFGQSFNDGQGGYFVMRRSAARGIATWFWPRLDPSIPHDISTPTSPSIYESMWSTPWANFPSTPNMCDMTNTNIMSPHEIIFDLTFCGDWAGNVWYAFTNAYWEIKGLRWYEEA
ncbi:hypothetical protein CI109_100734 [Kwoniella shandongensis]|uniref:GH16 domain-containing protein n=1 Tax=Kwoniella shandongensis TaxID=1734106 RepID=A0AAJ8LD20_9TREE